jgi:hypothetical protein
MDVVKEVLSDQNFIGAILGLIVFIFLGFILRRKGILKDGYSVWSAYAYLSFVLNGVSGVTDGAAS